MIFVILRYLGARRLYRTPSDMEFAILWDAAASLHTILHGICYSLGRSGFTAHHSTWNFLFFGTQQLHRTPSYMVFATLWGAAASTRTILYEICYSLGRG